MILCHRICRLLLLTLLAICGLVTSEPDGYCRRIPSETRASRTPGDNGFKIRVIGTTPHATYTPNKKYTITLNGTYPRQRLLGFMLVAVPKNARDENVTIGRFQHVSDHLTKSHERCPNVITDRYPGIIDDNYRYHKMGVTVLWTAPPAGSGCVEFRATVQELKDIWYKDDGALTKEICEDTGSSRSKSEKWPDNGECCACGTAKYRMTFQGNWTRQRHPKDFPTGHIANLIHWSNLIGATHGPSYKIWQFGDYASEAVRWVCEYGSPGKLETQFKQHSSAIRTVISTHGLWGMSNLMKPVSAHFSVSKKHHLMSVLTMFGPSPDWCVGVPSLSLCLPNCTWAGDQTIDLYPWDAGTDSGITYASPNMKTHPQEKIHRLTNTYPDNIKSPFYGLYPIKPLAQLHIKRLTPAAAPGQCTSDEGDEDPGIGFLDRRVEKKHRKHQRNKNKDRDRVLSDEEQKQMIMKKAMMEKCPLSEWEDWSKCSVTCGIGMRVRFRKYLKDVTPAECQDELMDKEECLGFENICNKNDKCATTNWSQWSPCSVTCGKGVRERTRMYLKPEMVRRCSKDMTESEMCMTEIMDCRKAEAMLDYADICQKPYEAGRCKGSFRRWYFDKDMQKCLPFVYGGCRGNKNNFETEAECNQKCSTVMQANAILMAKKLMMQFGLQNTSSDSDRRGPTTEEVCLDLPDVGPCYGDFPRWYYSFPMGKCLPFKFGGCGGNNNRFFSQPECEERCVSAMADKVAMMEKLKMMQGQQHGGGSDEEIQAAMMAKRKMMQQTTEENEKSEPDKIDCMVTQWTEWSSCSVTCGRGRVTRYRMIKVQPENGGKKCPKKMRQRKKCKHRKCSKGTHKTDTGHPEKSSRVQPVQNTQSSNEFRKSTERVDCVLGGWGPWTPCAKTCGYDSIQERSKHVLVEPQNGGRPCGPKLQRRYCNLQPCY
ncbi:spondin-1-like [Lingula anatina]|uniref:Spondin-1 n=1 Tax=Lingula anatina TaxID=7574 RepID=A0A1S3HC49_LINAN|nr:spondin-1-like [Lingula anatina]|eukprot:XP_013383602.1 spondin-1-like [Lingula anatina]